MSNIELIRKSLREAADPERAKSSAWFFKAGPGQYGEGDRFLGITVPQQRKIARKFYKNVSLDAVEQLLHSPWHEERLTALFMLVLMYQKGDQQKRDQTANLYLANTKQVNNWDLVDSSAPYILGPWLADNPYKMKTLTKLAKSDNFWERRIAMMSTFHYIRQGSADEALAIVDILLDDSHDLIQKAVGWMLREIGKRAGRQILLEFLDNHAATMPRTALRYAIEHLSSGQRQHYLALAKRSSHP